MENSNQVQESISEYYDNYQQTQTELIALYSKKTRNAIFTIACLWLASDLLGLAIANAFNLTILLSALVVPAILIGTAFMAMRQPLIGIIIAALVFLGVWVLTIVLLGGIGAISGLLVKAAIIYFLIAGFQNAKEVQKIKKEMAG